MTIPSPALPISLTKPYSLWTPQQWIDAWQSKLDTDPGVVLALIASLDFSTLPTSDPGGGRLWLNGGLLQVGP